MTGTTRGPRPFLGWAMVALAFALYGLGMAPAYYAWGFLAPLYYLAGSVCLVAGFENAAMVWTLPTWQPDVPSLSVALARRAEARRRGLPTPPRND